MIKSLAAFADVWDTLAAKSAADAVAFDEAAETARTSIDAMTASLSSESPSPPPNEPAQLLRATETPGSLAMKAKAARGRCVSSKFPTPSVHTDFIPDHFD